MSYTDSPDRKKLIVVREAREHNAKREIIQMDINAGSYGDII